MTQLLQNAAAGTVLILAAALLRRALKKRLPPEVWLVLWAVCLLRLLAPAVPESPLSLYALPRLLPAVPAAATPAPTVPAPSDFVPAPSVPTPAPASPPAPGGAVVLPGVIPPRPMPDGSGSPPAAPAPDLEAVLRAALAAIWLLGGAVTAVRLVLSWRRTRRAVNCAILLPPSDPRYAALPPGVRLREGPVEGAPLTFGAVRPTVVLPPGLSGAALACVLAHEGVHARRRDNLWHYAVALARVLFWWDPAVWLLAKLLRRDIELSCDRVALRRLGLHRRQDYAMTILDLSTQGEGAPFSRAFGQKQAEERIIAIMKYKKMTALALALSILLVCGVTVAFATNPVDNTDEPAITDAEPADNTADPAPVETKPAGTEPVGSANDPAPVETEPTGTEPVETEPAPVEPEPVEAEPVEPEPAGNMIAISEDVIARIMEDVARIAWAHIHEGTQFIPTDLSTQAICQHTNYVWTPTTSFVEVSRSQHQRVFIDLVMCRDCGYYWDNSPVTYTLEDHTFGPDTYISADHSAANPAKHFYTRGYICSACKYADTYTVPIGCTIGGCIIPGVMSTGDGET